MFETRGFAGLAAGATPGASAASSKAANAVTSLAAGVTHFSAANSFLAFAAGAVLSLNTAHSSAPLIGHNVSPTSYTLKKGELTLGNYAVGIGITDQWMIATSPWMIVNYNMPMLSTRYAFQGDDIIHRFAFEFDYFKTFEYGFNYFKQESFFLRLIATHEFSSSYTVHISAGYQHFFDDTSPYSIRPTYELNDPTTLSLGALHEISIDDRWGVFLETALLGLNYPVVYAHVGASLYTRANWGLVQLGLSRSMPLQEPGWYYTEGASESSGSSSRELAFMRPASFHPEIQVQFSF